MKIDFNNNGKMKGNKNPFLYGDVITDLMIGRILILNCNFLLKVEPEVDFAGLV